MRRRASDVLQSFFQKKKMPAASQDVTESQLSEEARKRRKEMLHFRDVADDLDFVRINRDFVLSLKMLRYGPEYTIDLALEKELSYHQLHASRELRFNAGKLIEGPSTLIPERAGIPLPLLSLQQLQPEGDANAGSDGSNSKPGGRPPFRTESVTFGSQSIQRPTMLHVVHLATSTMEHVRLWNPPSGIDTVVIYNLHSSAIRAFKQYLLKAYYWNGTLVPTHVPVTNCYYGEHVLRPFLSTFCIRNFYLNHVMLLDHKGKARWLSSWIPTERETKLLPGLYQQLEREYIQAKANSTSPCDATILSGVGGLPPLSSL